MSFIRVDCPEDAFTADQKAKLAPRLVEALIRQEIDPVTEIGTAAGTEAFACLQSSGVGSTWGPGAKPAGEVFSTAPPLSGHSCRICTLNPQLFPKSKDRQVA
jgi:hypothetical protein